MSLTSLINREFKDFFKEIIPRKKEFKTISEKVAFAKDYYKEYAEYKLENPYNSGVVGTAFDYIARWIIARTVNTEKETSYLDLIAEKGAQCCEFIALRNKTESILKRYGDEIKNVECFVNGVDNKEKIIRTAIFFAKLEQVWRSGVPALRINIDDLLCVEDEIFDDLVILSDVFQNKVIDSGLVTENSIVVYNPSFGRASKLCGGADADIYIDGTLYDFKCTKKVGYVWNEVAQILGYYLLDNISKKNNDPDNKLGKYKIDRIAFYRARFGEIEYYDIREGNYEKAIEQLSGMLEKERDQEDLVKMKRQREGEKERRRREEEERKRLIFEQEYKDIERVHNRLLKYTKCEFFLKDLEKCVNKRERLDSMKANIEVCYNNRIQDKIDGKKLERKMSINGIDIKTLSQKLGKKQSTIKNWLEEKNNPTAGALIDMTEIFSCSINGLIKDNPSKKRYVSIWRAQKNRKKK